MASETNKELCDGKKPIILDGTFFEVQSVTNNNVTANCVLCKANIKGNILTTSNFLAHLKVKHPGDVARYEEYKQKTYIPFMKRMKSATSASTVVIKSENSNRNHIACSFKRNRQNNKELSDGKRPIILDGTFFEVKSIAHNNVTANCVLCKINIKGNILTSSNFLTHLKKKHPSDVVRYEEHKQKTYIPFTKRMKSSAPSVVAEAETSNSINIASSFQQKTSQNNSELLIAMYIAEASCPLGTVEVPAFINMVTNLSKIGFEIKCPTRRDITNKIHVIQQQNKKKIIFEIQKEDYFCATADIWSVNGKSFLGMTIHFLNENFERKSYALACRRFKGVHDYLTCVKLIEKVYIEYGLNEKNITTIVTDNGSNMMKSFKEFGCAKSCYIEMDENESEDEINDQDDLVFENISEYLIKIDDLKENDYSDIHLPFHHSCASHTYSLIGTTDVLNFCKQSKDFGEIYYSSIGKCFGIWNMLKKSSSKANEAALTAIERNLKTPCPTRWISLFHAVVDLAQLDIQKINDLCRKLNTTVFLEKNFEFLIEFKNIISPIANTLDKLQSDKNITMGDLIPCVINSVYKLDKIILEKPKYCTGLSEHLKKSVKNRFDYCFDGFKTEKAKHYILATVCNPKWKLKWCFNYEQQQFVRKVFLDEIIKMYQEKPKYNDVVVITNEISDSSDNFYEFIEDKRNDENIISGNELELQTIMNNFLIEKSESIEILNKYSIIKSIFLKYNTGIPSSAPVERLFNFASMILSPKRILTSDENFENLLLLKANGCETGVK